MGTDPPSMTTWWSSAKVGSGIMIRLPVASNGFGLLPHRRSGGPRRLGTGTTARPAPVVRRRSAAPMAQWDRLGGSHRPIRTSPSASRAPLRLREAKDRRIRSYSPQVVDESVQVRHGCAHTLQVSGELLAVVAVVAVVGEPACDRRLVCDEVVEEAPARCGVADVFVVQGNVLGRCDLESTPPGDLPATGRRLHRRRSTNVSRLGPAGRTGRSPRAERATVVYVRRLDEGSRPRRARAAR